MHYWQMFQRPATLGALDSSRVILYYWQASKSKINTPIRRCVKQRLHLKIRNKKVVVSECEHGKARL